MQENLNLEIIVSKLAKKHNITLHLLWQ